MRSSKLNFPPLIVQFVQAYTRVRAVNGSVVPLRYDQRRSTKPYKTLDSESQLPIIRLTMPYALGLRVLFLKVFGRMDYDGLVILVWPKPTYSI